MTDLDDRYATDTPRRTPPARARYNPGRTQDGDLYQRAERHSRLVRRLKFILPALALAAIAVFWGTARFIPGDLASLVAIAGIDATSNSVIMQKPHISGFEGTRRAYEVKADSATQSLDDPKVVTFKQIVGRFGLDDAGTATVDATLGVYDGNQNLLTLKDGINVQTTNGYAGKFTDASIDLGKGSMTSAKPIELNTAEGTIRANGVTVIDRENASASPTAFR